MHFHRPWCWLAALLASASTTSAKEVVLKPDPDMKSIGLRTHSFSPPYLDSQMQSRWFDFGGDTVIRTDQYIRLTAELSSRAGWLFSKVPLTATNWEVEVEFKISGTNALYGDGMAIWLTKQRAQGGPVFGFIDKFEGLGILLDTYKNDRPGVVFPYVMAMMGDGHTAYDKEHDGKSNELAGCPAHNIRNNMHPTRIKITYYHEKALVVQLQTGDDPTKWEDCFSLPDIKVPAVTYLGFTAETGELHDNHDIVRVETRNLYRDDGAAGSYGGSTGSGKKRKKNKNRDPRQKREGSGWGWFMIKFLMLGGLVAGCYAGFTAYRSHKYRSRF